MEQSLLFFDSFFHANEQAWLDMVKFNHPVKISEIRVVPNDDIIRVGYMVREGRTKPEEIELDFFVRDVEKPDAATFVDIGGYDYSEQRSPNFNIEKRVLTDVLLIKGTYKCLTVAVIGYPTNTPPATGLPPNQQTAAVIRPNNPSYHTSMSHDSNVQAIGHIPSLLGPPASGDAMSSDAAGSSSRYGNQNRYQHSSSNYVKRGIEPTTMSDDSPRLQMNLPPPVIEVDELFGASDCNFDDVSSRLSGLEDIASVDNFGTFVPQEATPVASLSASVDLLKTAKSTGDDKTVVNSWLEKSTSAVEEGQQGDEDFIDTVAYYQQEHEQLAAIVAAAAVAQQGVGEHQLSCIGNFTNPSATPFEIAVARFTKEQATSAASSSSIASSPPKEAQKLLSLVEDLLTGGEDTQQALEGMVKTLEQACQVLPEGLAYWYVFSESTYADLLDSLCEWAMTAADYVKAVKVIETSPLFKVRAVKAGLHLLCQIVILSPDCTRRVLSSGRVQQHLIELLSAHSTEQLDQKQQEESVEIVPLLTSPLEHLVVRALFFTCAFEQGVSVFVDQSKSSESLYLKFLLWLVSEKRKAGRKKCLQRRCFEPATMTLKSISAYEMVIVWRSLVTKLASVLESNNANDCVDLVEQICACYEWSASVWSSISSSQHNFDDKTAQIMSFSRYLKSMKLPDTILVLLSDACSIFSRDCRRRISTAIATFLEALSSTKTGLLFLLCDGHATTQLIRQLVMMSGQKLQQIGIDLSYRLLMLQLLDQLTASTAATPEGSDVQTSGQHVVVLRTLAGLVGRQHCVHLLAGVIASDNQHVEMLLRIAEANLPTAPEVEYVIMLLKAVVVHAPSVALFKSLYGERVLNICKHCDDGLGGELRMVLQFLDEETATDAGAGTITIKKLCNSLKQLTQSNFSDSTRLFSPNLLVACRLIWNEVKPPKNIADETELQIIERQVALAALWGQDLFPVIVQVLQLASEVRLACVQRTCFPPPAQQQSLYSVVICALNILTSMVAALAPTGIAMIDVEALISALLQTHAGFCAIPPSSSLCLSDAIAVHKDLILCLHETFLMPVKITVSTKPPIQIRLLSELIKQTLSSPSLHLSGLVLLADLLSSAEDTISAVKLHAVRQTFTSVFFAVHRPSSNNNACDLSKLISSLYLTDSPPLQSALFRFLRALASVSRTSAVGVLRVSISLALDNLVKVASSLRSTAGDSSDSHSPESSASPSEGASCFSGDFVSSPFYAACKALALVTHIMATSPVIHAALVGELAHPATDRQGQPFRQIVPDLSTVLAGCCRRLARLSPLCAVEFMLHAFDFYTQLVASSFISRGGVTRYLPVATLTTIAAASFRCLVGSKSSLSNLLNDGLMNDGAMSPDAGGPSSSVPSGVQQAAWRLLSVLAEERDAAAIWAVTDAHPAVIHQSVIEACEPIASGASSLDEEALATLTEMVITLTTLANRPGCGPKVSALVCHGSGESNPVEQLLHQLAMMDLITGEGIDLAAAATADGASAAHSMENTARGVNGGNVDSTGLTDRLQLLVDVMKRPAVSNSENQGESVPGNNETEIGQFLEEVFADVPADPFDTTEQEGSDEPARFWWLVAESVHDASCTVESCQRVRVDLDATARRFCENIDLSAEIIQGTTSLVDVVTAPGRLAGSGVSADARRGRSTINTSRQMRRYVAPMRGRGWLGPPSGSGHRAPPPSLASLGLDIRGRAPNTSRPPSMHVDDFQRFERVAPPSRGGYRGRNFDPNRAYRGGYGRGGALMRSPLLPTPPWSKGEDRGDISRLGGNSQIIDELLALANDPVVMAASAISGFAGLQGADLTSSMAAFPFLSSMAANQSASQQQQQQQSSASSTSNATMDALLKAAASSSSAAGVADSGLPPFPLPIPLQILPLLEPAELAKLAASIFDNNNGNAASSDEADTSRQRSPSSGRRRRETERSSSHDSDYERDQRESSSRHRSSSRRN